MILNPQSQMQTLLNLNKIGAKIKNHNFIELYKQNEKKKSRIIQNFDSLKTNSLPMFVYTHNQKKKKIFTEFQFPELH